MHVEERSERREEIVDMRIDAALFVCLFVWDVAI